MSETGVQQPPRYLGPCADIGALLRPACSGRVLGCQASATRHATRVTTVVELSCSGDETCCSIQQTL